MFPVLYAFVADHKEASLMSNTKMGHLTPFPCCSCTIPNTEFNVMTASPETAWRTETHLKSLLAASDYDALEAQSVHPCQVSVPGCHHTEEQASVLIAFTTLLQCALWDWNIIRGYSHPALNPYRAFMVEIMHMGHLGIVAHVIHILEKVIPKATLLELNSRVRLFPHYPGLILHSAGYFKQSHITAAERKHFMKVLVASCFDIPLECLRMLRALVDWHEVALQDLFDESDLHHLTHLSNE